MAFVDIDDLPEDSAECELCHNRFSIQELNGERGYAIYPVGLLCGHIFCYDCSRMWISHAKCPECDARFEDPTAALASIDAQINRCNQYLIAVFNGRLQAGLIRAPPGYPTFAGQNAGSSNWWHDEPKSSPSDVDDDATISDGVSESAEPPSNEGLSAQGHEAAPELNEAVNDPFSDDSGEMDTPLKSELTAKELRVALMMINKQSGTNYCLADFPDMHLQDAGKSLDE